MARPRLSLRFAMSSTSQITASDCDQDPMLEMVWPMK
jgi:hypothetical protein